MSTTSKFMERFGQRVRTRDVVRVSTGSSVRLSLSFLRGANTPEAARILVKRQLPLRTAHAVLTEMVEGERAPAAMRYAKALASSDGAAMEAASAEYVVLGDLLDVFGEQRHFAAATRRVDDEVRHREA